MASNKNFNNPLRRRMVSVFNISRVLIFLYITQLSLSRVNGTPQVSISKKPYEVKHFILVHGQGHGAWCWYKLMPLLEHAGHKVTAIDLSASGINTKQIRELRSFNDYSAPLLELIDSLPQNDKVILVGHSFGGMSLALAMDMYPNKISLGAFVSALMPDTANRPSYVIEKFLEQVNITETFLDTVFYTVDRPNQTPLLAILYGPESLKFTLYQLSRPQDLELAKTLIRPGFLFLDDLSIMKNFTKEGYGSVKKVYIKNQQDRSIPEKFQSWLIENEGVKEVKEIKRADHMAMISSPQELCKLLLEAALELG